MALVRVPIFNHITIRLPLCQLEVALVLASLRLPSAVNAPIIIVRN